MADEVTAFAPAKINLCLHVTGQRADGYHLLDSLVGFASVGDQITVRPAPVLRLEVTGPRSAGVPYDGRNLALKAARLTGQGADITLDKHLPAAAGIGGGSSDAAATLRALTDLTGAPLPPLKTLLRLGADVPVCLLAKGARMRGIGEQVDPVTLPLVPSLLINPGVEVPTPAVFAALDSKENEPLPNVLPAFADVPSLVTWLRGQRNDLQRPAIAAAPVIEDALAALAATDAGLFRMSGSGATCFGLFASDAARDAAANQIAAAQPGWWVQPVTLS
ncbi:MAG: 4-(cytidine 5'-diphospho)-2-C-methyl-D-erythritol kinase [Brevirhabdus sp.]